MKLKAVLRFFKSPFLKILSSFPSNIVSLGIRILQQSKGFGFDGGITSEISAIQKFCPPSEKRLFVLDVGANKGDWSENFVKRFPNCEIHAFEPNLSNHTKLEKLSLRINQIIPLKYALGEVNSQRILYSDSDGSGLASLTKRDLKHLGIDFDKQEEINQIRLDSYLSQFEVTTIDVLKIDVEGNELDVLLGMGSLIKNCRLVQFEFGGANIDTRSFFKDYWDYFDYFTWELYRITPTGPIKVLAYSEFLEVFTFTNYLAVRRPN